MAEECRKKTHSIENAAELLSLSMEQVEWLIDTHQLNPIFVAKSRLILDSELDQLLQTYQIAQGRAVRSIARVHSDKNNTTGAQDGPQSSANEAQPGHEG